MEQALQKKIDLDKLYADVLVEVENSTVLDDQQRSVLRQRAQSSYHAYNSYPTPYGRRMLKKCLFRVRMRTQKGFKAKKVYL